MRNVDQTPIVTHIATTKFVKVTRHFCLFAAVTKFVMKMLDPKCTKTDDCLSFPFLLHDPYKGVCNLVDGKCSDCLTNSDCLPWSPSTCGAVCKNSILTRENLCYDAVKCNNFQTCNLTSNNNFGCFANSNAIAKEPTFWLYVGFLIFIVYLIFCL